MHRAALSPNTDQHSGVLALNNWLHHRTTALIVRRICSDKEASWLMAVLTVD